VNILNHLKKINNTQGRGDPAGYWQLVCSHGLGYLLNRPALIRTRRRLQYKDEKKLLYTVLTGDYDQLNEISKPLVNWDCVCFTDNAGLRSSSWRIVALDNKLNLDPVRLSRHFKINNHLVDGGYDLSIYVDANIKLRGDLDTFLSHALPPDKSFGALLHPFNSSLEAEVALCAAAAKEDTALLHEQYRFYVAEQGFDDRFPHINARLLIRRAGDPAIRKLMEFWFSQLLRWSRRDQVAFNYALSRCPGVTPHYIPYWIFRRYFKKMDHR
jgi:hypothetical protein